VWTQSVLLLDPPAIKFKAINTIKYTTTISMENQENKVAKKKKKRVKIYEQVEIKYLQILLIV
jgi:hypothetical protein